MTKPNILFIALACTLILTGCMSREQADETLVKGCVAGINALLSDGTQIGPITDTSFSPSPEGQGFRHVSITAKELDGWLDAEQQYECTFEESFSFMNMGYSASIYQLRFNDRVVGKAGNEILGTTDDFIKLTDAVRKALYE